MNDRQADANHLPGEESRAGSAPHAAGALDVTGPTARQELFLRRQQLWTEELSREQASRLIDDFLTRKHSERRMSSQCRDRVE